VRKGTRHLDVDVKLFELFAAGETSSSSSSSSSISRGLQRFMYSTAQRFHCALLTRAPPWPIS